jgi:hypothetical protein
MEFRIADTFTDSLARLTGEEQKAVKIRLSGILRSVKLLYYQILISTYRRSNILRSESSGAPDL